MEISLLIVIFSHLSDVQENPEGESNHKRINFVKYLLNKYRNTNVKIDAVNEWNIFNKEV